jgi:hypothetical protein
MKMDGSRRLGNSERRVGGVAEGYIMYMGFIHGVGIGG